MQVLNKDYTIEQIHETAQELLELGKNQKVWTFKGDLGAGKTTLIKELAHELGCQDSVSSPTYTIVNTYEYPKGNIFHIDAYRLKDEAEAYDAGLEEILYSDEYIWIEWPEKIEQLIPESHIEVQISSQVNYRTIKVFLQ